MEGGLTGMEALTTAVTNAISIVGQGIDFVTGEPLLLVGIGMSLLIAGVGFFRRLV